MSRKTAAIFARIASDFGHLYLIEYSEFQRRSSCRKHFDKSLSLLIKALQGWAPSILKCGWDYNFVGKHQTPFVYMRLIENDKIFIFLATVRIRNINTTTTTAASTLLLLDDLNPHCFAES